MTTQRTPTAAHAAGGTRPAGGASAGGPPGWWPVPRAVPRWWAGAARGFAALTVVIVAGLWVGHDGLRQLTGGGPAGVQSLGRLAGLVSADLLLLQVLLMARVPVAERAFGQDRLARWHRVVGFWSVNLMGVHILLITLAYAAQAGINPVAELWELIVDYPGMLLATAGTLALVLVAVTSVRAARARLRYESWHLLHLYAYLGAGLALPHQLWTGTSFVDSPAATAFWWTLWGVAAGTLIVFRLAVPVWRNARHRLIVTHVTPEGPGLTSVYLSGRDLDRLPARAGQFFQWRFRDGRGWSRAHPFSLSASPRTGLLRITVKDLGDGSARVAALRPGTRALIEGPFGALTGADYHGGPLVMMAGGIGVTPLLTLLADLPWRAGEATLIYRARGEAEIALRADIDWLVAHRGLRVLYALGPRPARASWMPRHFGHRPDAEVLLAAAPGLTAARVFICGPAGWADAARAAAVAAGVPAARLHTEQFAW